ncbi:MAG: nuclear transport factor 2 family protein [Caulobacter sp.]|nr:nuclear transport factor 2 family protein [Caulobacter sp.]
MDPQALLAPFYEAYNRRDIPAALRFLTPDVDWPDLAEGGRLIGAEALAASWKRNVRSIQVEMAPFAYGVASDNRLVADLVMTVHNLRGQLWSETLVRHLFTLHDGLISRMDVEPLERRI